MAREKGHGDAEGGDLRQGQVHEDDPAGQHVQAQVDVDAREHEAGEKGDPEEIEHQRGRSASARRAMSRSKSPI